MDNEHTSFGEIFWKVHEREQEKNRIKYQHLKYEKNVNPKSIIQFSIKFLFSLFINIVLLPFVIVYRIILKICEPIGFRKIIHCLGIPFFVVLETFINTFSKQYRRCFYKKVNPEDKLWDEYELFYKH